MSELVSGSRPAVADDLAVHLTEFIAALAKAGYAEKTRHDKQRLSTPFVGWVRKAGIAITDVDEACVDAFLACPSRRRYKHGTALHQFVEHLRSVEAVPPRGFDLSPAEVLFKLVSAAGQAGPDDPQPHRVTEVDRRPQRSSCSLTSPKTSLPPTLQAQLRALRCTESSY